MLRPTAAQEQSRSRKSLSSSQLCPVLQTGSESLCRRPRQDDAGPRQPGSPNLATDHSSSQIFSRNEVALLDKPAVAPKSQFASAFENSCNRVFSGRSGTGGRQLRPAQDHAARFVTGSTTLGNRCSMALRLPSSQGGSIKCVPSSSGLSSTEKPGGSVAISKSTPPGS